MPRTPAIRALRAFGTIIPGDYLKTLFYRNLIAKPRATLRRALLGFYRFDHVYAVLEEVKAKYKGSFSILEFGTHQGYAFTKMLYATRYLGMADRVTGHAFDTFEGLPAAADRRDRNVVGKHDVFFKGQFPSDYEAVDASCRRYGNYALHKGLFEESLTPALLRTFETQLPILVWIDCDYYSSTRTVFERILPYLPSGCVIYFDDFDLNYGSRLTGEARVIHELNHGAFGEGIELVLDGELSLGSKRVYRLVRLEGGPQYERAAPVKYNPGRKPSGGSPLP